MRFLVTYDILVEPRTSSFLGSTRSDIMNLTTTVEAMSATQASAIVEAQNGGYTKCLVKSAYPQY